MSNECGLISFAHGQNSDLSAEQIKEQAKWFACPEDVVIGEFSFVRAYKGWVLDRFNDVADKRFSFVHIDLDLYKPIAETLDFFTPRMLENGIIELDDYGSSEFPGAN